MLFHLQIERRVVDGHVHVCPLVQVVTVQGKAVCSGDELGVEAGAVVAVFDNVLLRAVRAPELHVLAPWNRGQL